MNTLVRKGTVRCVHLIKHALCCPRERAKVHKAGFFGRFATDPVLNNHSDREASIVLVIEHLPDRETSASISRGS